MKKVECILTQLAFFVALSGCNASDEAEILTEKTVRVLYIIPSDVSLANQQARVSLAADAVENNRQLWSRYGATFNTESPITVQSEYDTNWFLDNPDGYHGDLQEWYWLGNACNIAKTIYPEACSLQNLDPDHKYILFIEAIASNAGAAANFGAAVIPQGIIDAIEQGADSEIGAIGHELGHTFDIEHENCDEQSSPWGIMCNGGHYPDVELNEYHFKQLFNEKHSGFFVERSQQ